MEASKSPLPGIHPARLHGCEIPRTPRRANDVGVSGNPARQPINRTPAIDGRGDGEAGVRVGSVKCPSCGRAGWHEGECDRCGYRP